MTLFPVSMTNCQMFSTKHNNNMNESCKLVSESAVACIFIGSCFLYFRWQRRRVRVAAWWLHVTSFMQECRISKPCSSRSLFTCLEWRENETQFIQLFNFISILQLFSFHARRGVLSLMQHQEEHKSSRWPIPSLSNANWAVLSPSRRRCTTGWTTDSE